jgi:hypothetical protein
MKFAFCPSGGLLKAHRTLQRYDMREHFDSLRSSCICLSLHTEAVKLYRSINAILYVLNYPRICRCGVCTRKPTARLVHPGARSSLSVPKRGQSLSRTMLTCQLQCSPRITSSRPGLWVHPHGPLRQQATSESCLDVCAVFICARACVFVWLRAWMRV